MVAEKLEKIENVRFLTKKISLMYQPERYRKDDPNYLFEFIQKHPFASFIIQGKELMATHIPLLPVGRPEKFRLFGHIANHNEQCQYLKNGLETLLIFQGAQAYVSSSWYRKKDVSTWDYSAVHVNARLILQEPGELASSLEKLVHQFERHQDQPLWLRNLPDNLVKDQLSRITGFWCEIIRIRGIAKLHQGFEEEDLRRIMLNLEKQEDPQAKEISNQISKEHGL